MAVSDRWRETIKGAARFNTVVDYSNDGGTNWTECKLVSGSVTESATSQTRWTCQLVLTGAEVSPTGLNGLTTRLRIRCGLVGFPLQPLGVYRLDKPQQSLREPSRVTVSGESFESYLIDATFPTPRSIGPASADKIINDLIKEILSRAQIVWDKRLNRSHYVPRMTGEDRWAMIDGGERDPSVAKSVGGMAYCGASGEWIVAPPGALDDPVAWTAAVGETVIDATVAQSRDDIANIVTVSGQTTEGVPVRVTLRDEDKGSVTYWGRSPDDGGFGQKTFKYTSSGVTSTGVANRVALSILQQRLGARWPVSFTRLFDPSLRAGTVGLVDTPQGQHRMIADSLTWSWAEGGLPQPMTGELRSKDTPTR